MSTVQPPPRLARSSSLEQSLSVPTRTDSSPLHLNVSRAVSRTTHVLPQPLQPCRRGFFMSGLNRDSMSYSYGTLMLSADASPDSQTGMFRASNMSSAPWQALASLPLLPSETGEKSLWKDHGVRTYHDRLHGIAIPALAYQPDNLFHQHPLATRAWCFQERRLARRIVHLNVDEMSWDCDGGVVECQCGYFGPGSLEFGSYAWHRGPAESECSTTDKHNLWMNTVYEYSVRVQRAGVVSLVRSVDCPVGAGKTVYGALQGAGPKA